MDSAIFSRNHLHDLKQNETNDFIDIQAGL